MVSAAIPQLRWKLEPYPDEGIRSFLRRSAFENRIGSIQTILKKAKILVARDFMEDRLPDELIANLAHTLGVGEPVLRSMLYCRVRGFQDLIRFQGRVFPFKYLIPSGRRVSPSSLAKAPYDRELWEIHALPFCPDSMELLISRCIICGNQLLWKSSLPIECCQTCHADIRTFDATKIDEQDQALAATAANLLASDRATQGTAIAKLPDELQHLSGLEIFELGIQLGKLFGPKRVVTRHGNERMARRKLAAAVQASEILIEKFLLGFKLVAEWPESIDELTAGKPEQECNVVACNMAARLRKLASSPAMTDRLRVALKLRLPPLRDHQQRRVYTTAQKNQSRFNAEYAAQRTSKGLLTYPEAAEFIGVGTKALRYAVQVGLMSTSVEGIRGRVFKKADLETLRERLIDRMPEQQSRRQFGLSSLACQQLVAAGRVDGLRDTIAGLMDSGPYVRKHDLYDLSLKIHALAGSAIPTGNLVSLHEALRSVGARDKPWVPLIDAILSGDIPVHPAVDYTLNLEGLRIPRRMIPTVQGLRFSFDLFPDFERSTCLSGPEWAEYLNIGKPAKEVIIEQKLLPVHTDTNRYLCSLPAVEAFSREFISLWEMRSVLGVWSLQLPKMKQVFCDRGLKPAHDLLFWNRQEFNERVLSQFLPLR
ncbi:MAG: hypothetical protein ACRCY3_11490 [Sphingorhabdus sp.]